MKWSKCKNCAVPTPLQMYGDQTAAEICSAAQCGLVQQSPAEARPRVCVKTKAEAE